MGDETLLERILSGDEDPKDLPLALLQSITNDFSQDKQIGQGGFGTVYKGELQNGIIVAVKRIEVNQITIDDVSFRREFNGLMNTNHQNVVRFLGFCSNTHHIPRKEAGEINLVNVRERLLCFEYIRNGSLDKHITDELRGLEWEPRYAIIFGICKGLFYLHEEKKIVHMDLKPPNILLDDHMVPKITDFGLSRSNEMSHTTGQRFGTPGYVAPEYEKDGKTSFKCDIYSLGVIITELVTGRKSVPHKNNVLRRWRHRWNKPPTLLQYRQVTRCIEISVRCRQQESGHRPSILEIVNILGESESMDGHTGQESAYLDDDMLRIEPLELKLNEEMSWSVKLTNKTKASFAFNIERPSQQYTIWPDKGIVTPGCNEYLVQITLQPQQRAPQVTQNADKIIFQSTKVPEGLRDEDITENIFHEEAGKVVDEVDLMIVYEPTKPKENCKSREDTNMPTEEVPEAKRRKIVESAFGKGKLGSSEKVEAASMETETETLKCNLLRVKQRITDGERNGLIPTEEAEDWVQRAEQAISEEADNRESFDQRCRIFGCSLNCRGNYKTSKKAAEKVDAVRKYISSTPLPDNVTRTPPPPPVVDLSTHSVQLPPSRERILKNALRCIKEDVEVGVIGIWGPDRDEKTHLLKKINDYFLQDCPFDFIIFVTASSELSVQAQIVSRLRTNPLPDVATQATRISELLSKKSFLLLVDDIRVKLDLQAAGIPYPLGDVQVPGRVQSKVVVTSISQSICYLMDVERDIHVPDLGEDEACHLFAKEFGAQDIYSDPGIGVLAEQLVRELKGLPSDLIRYGKIMQGIRDERRWQDAIDAVRKANLQKDDPLNLAEKVVRNLENATEDLNAKGKDVRREIADAELQHKTQTNEVKRWLQKVDKIIRDVEVISQDCKQLKKDVTILASEKLREVQECCSSCPNIVAVESMLSPVQEMPDPCMSVEDPNLKVALQYIKDDPTVGMIGIWGPRGVGKTHLLTKINNSFLEYCPFDIVILIKASSECTVQKVQAQIINRFSINQKFSGNVTDQIYELLKKRSFLVMVDDLCEKIDLSAVGIPPPGVVDQKTRKVVIMSQSQPVCDLMGVDKYIEVLGLKEEEACQLFEQNFGEQNLYNDSHIGVLAKKLVRELMGLPSELIHFGNTMRRRRNAREWEDVIDAVKTSNLHKDNLLCMADRIVGNLEDCTKDLAAKRNDVCQKIENVERKEKTSTYEVKRWLQKVDTIIHDVEVISRSYRQLKKDVTMEASEKLDKVKECLRSCPSTVAVESMPPPVQEMPGPSMSAENRNLQDALHFIKDEPTVGMIGIWGPGGVGKTHLLKNINNSFGEGMDFNFVLFVTASRGCSVEKVQSQIIERFQLQSTGSKSRTIYEYMKTKSFLLLLDDLWEEIDLEDVGIPYPLGNVNKLNRKVVLTTRLRKVCGQMKVKKELKVAYLQEHEAWQLFEENVGAETLSSPHIEALARELMKELKGLPLALITIGKAMYRKDEYQWETAIQYMQQSCCADDKDPIELGMETNVFRRLKFSYDNLRNKTLRDCFLTCALWPEDENIHKVDLAQCWMGLGLVNEHDIESSFRKSYSLIADLTAACLLEGCEYDDIESFFRKSHGSVKVHDVIRDMALWISCDFGENNDKWIVAAPGGRDKKVIILSNKAECISLMSNRIPIRFNLDPIELRILCLRNNRLGESIIVEAIKNCSSLTYLDLSGNNLKRIPEELCSLVKLEYLDLSENPFGETEVPHSFGKLINLKFLYLKTGGGIARIPAGVISSLKALQVIDLRIFLIESLSSLPEWIFRELGTLPQLKALGIMVECSAQFESVLGEAANLPVRYLTLHGDLGAFTRILSTNFAQRTLYELRIIGGGTRENTVSYDTEQPNSHFGALNNLRLSFMGSLREIKWMEATPAFIFPRLTCLELFHYERLSHLSCVMYLPRLERLYIELCSGMVQAFMRCHGDKLCNGQDKTKTFPCLKLLHLSNNDSLETIGDNGMEFPSLERLEIFYCRALKRLPFQLNSLPLKLKELQFDAAECWERLECEEGVKSFLQPGLKFVH